MPNIWCSLRATAQTSNTISFPCLTVLNHFCGTFVSLSALFCSDLTSVTSVVSWYSSINYENVWSLLLTIISAAAFVHTFAFLLKLFLTQWYMQKVSLFKLNTFSCHWRARLMPFTTTSSLAKLICWESLSIYITSMHLSLPHCYPPATPP